VSDRFEDIQKQVQQSAFGGNVSVGGDLSIESLNQTVNLILQSGNQKNSFCGLIKWIHAKSDSLENLKSCYAKEVLEVIRIRKASQEKLNITTFELKVLDLVFNYCHYYRNRAKVRSGEFIKFSKPEDYYLEMNKLVASGDKIRIGAIKLSSLITDSKMYKLVEEVEKIDEL
jgi:hypothetical protein